MKFLLNEYDVPQSIQNLEAGLNGRLTFVENHDCFVWDGQIPATTEIAIRNLFRDGRPPTFFVAMVTGGPNSIAKGPTAWTGDKVYLKNWHTGALTARVFFFR